MGLCRMGCGQRLPVLRGLRVVVEDIPTMKHPRDLTRDEQISETLAIADVLKQQGWSKVVISISRGGTYRVEAQAGETMAKRPEWRARQ